MIILPKTILASKSITKLLSPTLQAQPCGIDVTLKSILKWTSAGVVDFDNSAREMSHVEELEFSSSVVPPSLSQSRSETESQSKRERSDIKNQNKHAGKDTTSKQWIHLPPSSYLLQFHEHISVPLNQMAHLYTRSSLWRSGAVIHAGVVDAGYEGGLGGVLQVVNERGLWLARGARVAQVVFVGMEAGVERGYGGVYQGRGVVS